jgi:hypothetical protein
MSGGIITIVCGALMVILFLSELGALPLQGFGSPDDDHSSSFHVFRYGRPTRLFVGIYLTSKTVHKLEVDTSRGEKITINVCYQPAINPIQM